MTDDTAVGGQSVQRGASEDASGSPLTPTEVQASERPPSQPAGDADDSAGHSTVQDSAGMAGGASGGTGGGSSMQGHPDAAR